MRKIAFLILSVVLMGCSTQKPVEPVTAPQPASARELQPSPPEAKPISYAARIRAAIKRHIYYPQSMIDAMGTVENPQAEVEITTAPTGEILQSKLIKSSGVRTWDESVLRAVQSTRYIPLDENGKSPPVLVVAFRPRP